MIFVTSIIYVYVCWRTSPEETIIYEPNSACNDGEFRCAFGKCIPDMFRCDGEWDCDGGDKSDEAIKCHGRHSSCVLTEEEENILCGII